MLAALDSEHPAQRPQRSHFQNVEASSPHKNLENNNWKQKALITVFLLPSRSQPWLAWRRLPVATSSRYKQTGKWGALIQGSGLTCLQSNTGEHPSNERMFAMARWHFQEFIPPPRLTYRIPQLWFEETGAEKDELSTGVADSLSDSFYSLPSLPGLHSRQYRN